MDPFRWVEKFHYFLCYQAESYQYIIKDDIDRLRRAHNVLYHAKRLAIRVNPKPSMITCIIAYLVYIKYDIEVDFHDIKKLLRVVGMIVKPSIVSQEMKFLQAIDYNLSCIYDPIQ